MRWHAAPVYPGKHWWGGGDGARGSGERVGAWVVGLWAAVDERRGAREQIARTRQRDPNQAYARSQERRHPPCRPPRRARTCRRRSTRWGCGRCHQRMPCRPRPCPSGTCGPSSPPPTPTHPHTCKRYRCRTRRGLAAGGDGELGWVVGAVDGGWGCFVSRVRPWWRFALPEHAFGQDDSTPEMRSQGSSDKSPRSHVIGDRRGGRRCRYWQPQPWRALADDR